MGELCNYSNQASKHSVTRDSRRSYWPLSNEVSNMKFCVVAKTRPRSRGGSEDLHSMSEYTE